MNGIVMGMAVSGILGWQTSLAIVLGSEIGAAVSSLLAASTLSINARRTSYAHLGFNLIGAAIAIALFPVLSAFVAFLVGGNPGKPVIISGITSSPLAPVAIATFVTSFNILGTGLLLPFIPHGARLLNRIAGCRLEEDDLSLPRFLFSKALDEPRMAIALFEKDQNLFRLDLPGFLSDICRPGMPAPNGPATLSPALESLHRKIIDFGESLSSREMTSDRSPVLEAMRRRYLGDGERQFMIKVLGHIEGSIWALNRLSQSGSYQPRKSNTGLIAGTR